MSKSNGTIEPHIQYLIEMIPLSEHNKLVALYQNLERERDEIRDKYTKKLELSTEKYEKDINDLKNQLVKKDEEISSLKTKILELELNLEEKGRQIDKLKDDVEYLKDKDEINKFRIAIQDLNASDKLEQNMISQRRILRRLRNTRNELFHCILDDDASDVKDYKKKLILDKLKNCSQPIKKLFSQKYNPDLLVDIIKYLETLPLNFKSLSQDDKETADDWWDE